MADAERFLDVSTYEAPHPLLLTLAAVQQLAAGTYLHMHHRMQPCILYDELNRRGFDHDTRRSADGMCEVFIWRSGDQLAAQAAQCAAAVLAPWRED